MRVKAEWDYVIDPNHYEVLTALKPGESCRWIRAGELTNNDATQMPSLIETLKEEKKETVETVSPVSNWATGASCS